MWDLLYRIGGADVDWNQSLTSMTWKKKHRTVGYVFQCAPRQNTKNSTSQLQPDDIFLARFNWPSCFHFPFIQSDLNFIVYVKPFLDLIVSVMYDMLLFAFDNVGDIENVGDKLTIQ